MNDNFFLFTTENHVDNYDEYDADNVNTPPPGREIANILIKELKLNGVKIKYDEVSDDNWEHSNWFIFAEFNGAQYTLWVQTDCGYDLPMKAFVSITKNLGCLLGLFATEKSRLNIDKVLLNMIENVLVEKCMVKNGKWVNEDEANLKIWD